MQRRQFIQGCGAAFGVGLGAGLEFGAPREARADTSSLRRARRPTPPYRVWYQPRCYVRDMSLYSHMTMDASGWVDPRLCELAGVTGLKWAYGPNHPDADSPQYWIDEGSIKARSLPKEQPEFIAAGIAVDEWIPPTSPAIESFCVKGLRAARQADPELFIAVWVTDLRPSLTEIMRDGTVDLAIIECYTHAPPRYGPDSQSAWPTCLRRCNAFKDAGLLDKTILSFGHITDELNPKGKRLEGAFLTEKMHEIKDRYPSMPGIGFFQNDTPDSPELRELVQHCNQLSGKLWPSSPGDK